MKPTILKWLTAVAWIGSSLVVLAQGTTAIDYQGELSDDGSPGNKHYDFQFTLYDAATAGSQIGPTLTVSDLPVANGVFGTTLDFGAGVFDGSARWLQIGVRPAGGGGNFTILTPRQQVYPVPYAIYAAKATTVDGAANLTFTGTVSFSPPSGPPFTIGSSVKVNGLNADLLDGLDSTAFVLKSGDTMSGNLAIANPGTLSFGNSVRQMLNLWDTQYGIGVQANTLYYRSHNNFAWFKDGVHSDAAYDPGTGGKVLMTLDANSRLSASNQSSSATLNDSVFLGLSFYPIGVNGVANGDGSTGVSGRASGVGSVGLYGERIGAGGQGFGVLGVSHSTDSRGVMGENDAASGIGVFGYSGPVNGASAGNGNTGTYGESAQSNGNGVVGVANNGSAAYGVWGQSASGYAGAFSGAVRIDFSSPPAKAQLSINEPFDTGFARLRMQTGSQPFWDIAVGSQASPDQTNSLRFFNQGPGGGDVMTVSPSGHVHLRVLTIDGGADVAEPFSISERNLSPGDVVVIDAAHPGQLKCSTQAYDTRVAGVISGAGGVNPGLSLNQRGVMEGDQPVALSGRVYVQADASYGPIQPGDLLTTSDTPGHAMKVIDHGRAQGAILGKAMTGLNKGKGLVLVLVTLQ